MALIVEDGSGVSGAESYLSVADADTYWSNRNDTQWSGADTADKEAALRTATQYIDATYNFLSQIERSDQALKWPRVNFYDRNDFFIDSIPNALKDATAELARDYIVNGDLLPSQSRGGDIRKVKAGSVEVEYGEAAPTQRTFNFVNRLLAAFTDGRQGSANMRLSRT